MVRIRPTAYREFPYADQPLLIGDGQTICAPSIVADFCDHIAPATADRTIVIWTRSGYPAVLTAEIVGDEHVFTVEVNLELAETARAIGVRGGVDSCRRRA